MARKFPFEVEAHHLTATEKDGCSVLCVQDRTPTTLEDAVRRAVFLWQFIPKTTKVKMIITHITEGDPEAGCTFWTVSRAGKFKVFDFIGH